MSDYTLLAKYNLKKHTDQKAECANSAAVQESRHVSMLRNKTVAYPN